MVLGKVTVGARSFDGVALAARSTSPALQRTLMGLHHIVLYEQLSNWAATLVEIDYAATMEESLRTRLINPVRTTCFPTRRFQREQQQHQRIDYLFPDGLRCTATWSSAGFW
jgi:hypothetical protein